MSEPCGMEEETDPRFRRLSSIGAVLNFVATVLALVAVATYHWATLAGPILGYMGPFIVCQDIPGGVDRCQRGGLGPYKQSLASYVAGFGAVGATVTLALGFVLSPLVVAMHHTKHAICLKFRHAIFARLILTTVAAVCSLSACIFFFLEASVFLRMQSDEPAKVGWSFYIEVIAFLMSSAVGLLASYEWRWSRKLGGDPTVYSRDPEGVRADTIENPNFRDAPRTGAPTKAKGGSSAPPKGSSRSGGVHRNANGVAMTSLSGLPYSLTANGSAGGKGGRANGHALNGKPRVAFDPKKIPLRSSLRRPKAHPPTTGEDSTDNPASGVVHNPTFASTSPTPKKKVRIHTQSTAV